MEFICRVAINQICNSFMLGVVLQETTPNFLH